MKKILAASSALTLALLTGPAFAAESNADLSNQIRVLQDQLRTMQQQLEALKTANAATQDAVVKAAEQKETEDRTARQKVLEQGGKLVTQNGKTEAIPAPRKKEWWDDTVLSGRAYYDVTNINHKSNGVSQSDNGTSFDIKRLYLGIDHTFDDMFSANITTDFLYDAGSGATQIYLKKAYIQAKFSDYAIARLGSADLPWVPFAEGIYGFRQVELEIADRTKYATSADWGAHLTGKFANGIVEYAIAAVDGAGYKHPFRSKSIDLEGRVSATYEGMTAALGGYTGKLGKNVEGSAPTNHTATRYNALLAYVGHGFHVGAEYFTASDWNNVTTPASEKSNGTSLFAAYEFMPQWSVLSRYDWVKPKRTTTPTLKDNYFNVGINYAPAKIVDFTLMYKREKAVNGTISTANGTIGGSVDGTYDEFGLWGQFRF